MLSGFACDSKTYEAFFPVLPTFSLSYLGEVSKRLCGCLADSWGQPTAMS